MSDVNEKLFAMDADLASALCYNSVQLPEIVAILATIEGENDGADWHWIVRLEPGGFAYVSGGCDYTGWDCQSNCEAFEAPDLASCMRLVPEAYRDELAGKLPAGELS